MSFVSFVVPLILSSLAFPSPAHATGGFAYAWHEGPVTVRWREGNRGALDPAVRALVGHWKRLAVSAWRPVTGPAGEFRGPRLRIDVTLYGPEMGSGKPHVRLSSHGRAVDALSEADGPLTDVGFLAALARLKPDHPGSSRPFSPGQLADDLHPRLSPDGRWCAFRTWRRGVPEVWLTSLDGRRVYRCAMPPGIPPAPADVAGPLIAAGPDWSPNGDLLTWIQGGRLCVLDPETLTGRIVTAENALVRSCTWSPTSRHAVVEIDDGQIMILDRARRALVPLHAALPQLIPLGGYSWSPSGRRLLFLAQGGVSSANFAPPSALARFLDRAVAAVAGRPRPSPPPQVVGDYRERLVLYDLAAGRLTTLPLEHGPKAISETLGAVWAPDEQSVYFAARSMDGDFGVRHLHTEPLTFAAASALASSPEPVLPLGWRGAGNHQNRPDASSPVPAGPVFLARDRLFTLHPGSPERMEPIGKPDRFLLAAGPDGGYLGVEDEEEGTENEPPRWVAAGSAGPAGPGAGRMPAKLPLPGGLYVSTPIASPVGRTLRALLGRGAIVDLDLQPDAAGAVAAASVGGGVGELIAVDPGGAERNLSRAVSSAAALATVEARVEPYRVAGARSGLAALTTDFQDGAVGRYGRVLIFAGIVGAVALWARRRMRLR